MAKKANVQSPVTRKEFQKGLRNGFASLRKELASKKELQNGLASLREELSAKIDSNTKGIANLSNEILDLKNRAQRFEEVVMTKEDGEKIIKRFDTISEWIITSKDKEPVQDHRLTDLETKSSDHETRIAHLESAIPK